jgi:type VI secretion system protein ImpL
VYFTSGTQEGTPIDRLLGAIGRRFAVAPEAVMQPAGRGKAYFIERLLKEVLFPESGLAGVNRRFELQMAAAQMGTYAAMVAIAVLGVIVWSVSYNRNRNYLDEVGADVAKFREVPLTPADVNLDVALPRLEAVRAVVDSANRHTGSTPWSMRWGLYQGGALGNAARDAYVRELDSALLPRVEALLRRRLVDYAPEPETLYEYLKAYLMLGDPDHFDKEHLAAVVDVEWKRAYAAAPDTAAALSRHFHALLDDEEKLRSIELDQGLIARARSTIRQASIPRIIYRLIRFGYADDAGRALRLDEAAGVGSDRVLRRKSGRDLSEPVPALYTKPVFEEVTGKSTGELVKQFNADYWVWGDARPSFTADAQLASEVIDVYEKDYIATWDGILDDFDVSFQSQQTADALATLAGPTSPLRNLLKTVDQHTFLAKPAEATPPTGAIATTKDRLGRLVNRGLEKIGVPTAAPGAQVTAHFARIHALVAGEPGAAPIDRVLGKLQQLQQQISPVGAAVGSTNPIAAVTQSGSGELVKSIRQDAAMLPPAVGGLVTRIADRAAGAVRADVRGELEARYQQDVLGPCMEIVNDKYPFVRTSSVDVRPEDFGRLFGYGGIFDTFFRERVEPLVNTVTRPWRWRPDASGVAIGGSTAMLRRLEAAQQIRNMYFTAGSMKPQMAFTVTPFAADLDSSRFVLEIDGQMFNYQFGPDRSYPVVWPGANQETAAVTWEERAGGRAYIAHQGAWAWQRLIDVAEMQPESDSRYVLTWRRENHYASVRIEAASLRNPFGKLDVQQFRCG